MASHTSTVGGKKYKYKDLYLKPSNEVTELIMRRCLRCDQHFQAKGRFNRTCDKCKDHELSPYKYIGGYNG